MNAPQIKSACAAIAAARIMASSMQMAVAQEKSRSAVVVCPTIYGRDSGAETSRKTEVKSVQNALQKAR